MSDLPKGWVTARLDELLAPEPAAITDGPFGSNLKTEHYQDSGPRVIRLQNIGDGAFRDERAHISVERFQALGKHEARAGDIIVAALGETLPRACLVPPGLGPAIVKADCIRVRLHPEMDARFVSAMLNSPPVRKDATAQISGVGRPRLNLAKIRSIRLPVPPLKEQERIVAAIEVQFSRLDAAVYALQSARHRVVLLRRAILSEAARCDYPRKTVGDIANLSDGPFGSNLKTSHYVEEGPRVIRLQNIGDGYFRDEKACITEDHFKALAKHGVRPNDVVVASLGADAPRACLIPSWLGPAIVKADCIRVRASADMDARFLMYILNSPPVRAQATTRIKGIGRPRLGLGGIRELEVPVPPLGEQRRVVSKVEHGTTLLAALDDSVGRALVRVDQLRGAILQRAFVGKLVRQDPNDEPAPELLARIASHHRNSNSHHRNSNKPRRRQRA